MGCALWRMLTAPAARQVEEAAQQEEAGAGDADPVAFLNDAPVEVSAADDDARELQQLLSQLDDEVRCRE